MKLGELCAGYGGLGMAVEEVFGAELAWVSEFDEAPSKILAHHWPNVPNHGDMTKIDWAAIEPVDIISGGTPCQDLSGAGRRKGMTEGTRSNLWVQMREAIATIRPQYVVWENVRGAYSATADSDLEQCPRCMGDAADGRAVLRALGRVLGDLSDLGYDAQWRGLRAADVGACHGRFRVFVLAQDPNHAARDKRRLATPRQTQSWRSRPHPGGRGRTLTPYPSGSRLDRRANIQGEGRDEGLWSEEVNHACNSDSPRRDSTADAKRLCGERWRVYGDLVGATGTSETDGGEREWNGNAADNSQSVDWGEYESAIRRWEVELGRPSPRPTEPTGRNQGHRLSPRFTEWMMGLPDGWVTDPAIGISRNEQLKACGNGVVPQQAMAAIRDMLNAFQAEGIEA